MEYNFSNNMADLKGSIIRELFKLTAGADVISFGGGNPSPLTFPVPEIHEIIDKVLKDNPVSVLQYGISEGYAPLRATLKNYIRERFTIGTDEDDILITSGSQQGADLISKCFVNAGDTVICETPSFVGCLNTFRAYGAKLVGVPMEQDGMDIAALEEALKANPKTKFIYTIPTFQNPSGITTSLAKRKAMYALAQKYNVLIMEDNPYGEIRFKGEEIVPIKHFDTDGRVLYCGSFSKIMAPAFRVGFVCMNNALMGKFAVAKQVTDTHTTVLFQYICNEFMTKYDLQGHIAKTCTLYGNKCNLMLSEMEKQFHPDITFTRPEGGMFIMATLPDGKDSAPFAEAAIKAGVVIIPGVAFLADTTGMSSNFRLNFSTPSDEDIVKGIEILGKMTYEYLG